MTEKHYDKLVRDEIPGIIRQSGKECRWRQLSHEEYLAMLDQKLQEELAEYQESKSLEELADLMEVIYAAARARGSSPEELERIRRNKTETRGGFERRILLEAVVDPDA
ncbi:MAG: phosphoribosyl-ATP pyrophosphohydrolase [Clostridiales bacterium]|nr:phosphoribosyl-ATP pyrophosphohydrolase [Clostridiales bacterium]